jgi:hypothetical protein
MRAHRWITTDHDTSTCLGCGLVVESAPFAAGQYPLACGTATSRCPTNGTHLIVGDTRRVTGGTRPRPIGTCHHCPTVWT